MKKEVFDKMLNSGEFEQLFNENKINDLLRDGNLSKEQIDKLVDLGKKMSKDEILRRQRDLAKQPGYKEHVLTPLIKKIIAQQGRARDPITGRYIKQETPNQQKAEEQPQEQPQQENPNADRTAERAEQMGQKFKPKRMKNMFSGSRGTTAKPATSKVNTELYSKIGQVQNPRLLKGDNAATVASKLYSIMKNDINEYNVRSKLERKRDKQYLDSEVKRHNEIIAALNRAGGGAGGGSKRTQTGMSTGAKLAIGAGLLGAAALARASEKPTPDVLPPEPKIDPPVPAPSPAPAPAPVPPKVNVEEETRRRQQEAERESAAQQEKQKREQERQQREAEQKQRESEQKKAAEEKAAEQEAKKKAEREKKEAADAEARKQKEQEDEDKEKAAEAKDKAAREEKDRKALEAEEKRKKDVSERIAKAEADNQRKEAERLRREEEKTAREEAARIKKEREDAEKEADAQKREAALQRKKQAEAIAAEIERQKSQKGDYQPPRNGPRELPYDESIGRRYPKPIVTPSPKEFKFKTGTQVGNYVDVPKRTATPVPAPAPAPAPVTRITGTGPTGSAGKISEFNKRISEKIGKAEGGQNIPVAYNTMNYFGEKDGSGDIRKEYTDSAGKKIKYGTNIIQRGLYDISTAEWNGKEWDFSKAKIFTENLSEMSIGEVLKLQNSRNDKFKGSSGGTAAGRYQFIRPTLANRAALLFGPNFRNVQFSEDIQELLQNENLIELATSLKSAKIPITEKSLYMMHFDGLAFTKDVTNSANIDKLIKDLPSWNDDKTKSNKDKAYTTVRKYLQSLSNFEDKSLNFEDFGKSVENFRAGGLTGAYYNTIIRKRDNETYKFDSSIRGESYKVIPPKQKSDKLSSVIIINNETTMLGSTNRSGLSIPTSPDNNAFYPYTA